MKIELLTNQKLKITFKADELEESNISVHSFLSVPLKSQKFFHNILRIANTDLNFDLSNVKISYELFSFDNELFIILVTTEKLQNAAQKQSFKFIGDKLQNTQQSFPLIFSFKNFKELSLFINVLKTFDLKQDINCSLYKYNNHYILTISPTTLISHENVQKLENIVSDIHFPLSMSENSKSRLLEFSNLLIKDKTLEIL